MTSREPRWTLSLRARAAGAGLLFLIGVALSAEPALAQESAPVLYQWTDEGGNVRYTPDPERVPSSRRDTMQRVEPGVPPASASPRPGPAPGRAPAASTVMSPTPPAAPVLSAPPAPVAAPLPSPTPATTPAPIAAPDPVAAPAPVAAPVPVPAPAPVASPPQELAPAAAPPAPAAAPAPTLGSGDPAGPASTTPHREAPSIPAPAPDPAAADAAREQQLAAAIAADQETLKALISAPAVPGEAPLTDSPQLREIARRLPELQAELAALRERRAPPAGP